MDEDVVAIPRRQLRRLYRAVVVMLVFGLGLGAALVGGAIEQQRTNDHQAATDERLEALIRSEARDDEEEDALACTRAYAGREDIRDAVETAYRINAETLVSFSSGGDPERIQAYKDQVERDVVEIRAEMADPDCDLEAARETLARSE